MEEDLISILLLGGGFILFIGLFISFIPALVWLASCLLIVGALSIFVSVILMIATLLS